VHRGREVPYPHAINQSINTVKRYYQCKKFRQTQHVTNMVYVPLVWNQASPCRLQTFLQAFGSKLCALLLCTMRFTILPVALCPTLFSHVLWQRNLHCPVTEHTVTVTAFTLMSIIRNTVCKNLYTCIFHNHFTLYMCAGLRPVQQITAHTISY